MSRLLPFWIVCSVIVVATNFPGDAHSKEAGPIRPPVVGLPTGEWKVEFTNGVTERCDVFAFSGEGHATVEEPRRRSRGRVEVDGGSVVMSFNDDRVERWTPVGNRFIVEHWFPGSRRATAIPVLGIAERIR